MTTDHGKALCPPFVTQSYSNVPANLDDRSKHAQAQPLYEKALEFNRRRFTDEHPAAANTYNNVAYNLDARGKYAQTQPLYEKALQIHHRLLTEDHPTTANSHNNLAQNLESQAHHWRRVGEQNERNALEDRSSASLTVVTRRSARRFTRSQGAQRAVVTFSQRLQ